MTEPLSRISHRVLVVVLAALGGCVPAKLDLFLGEDASSSTGASDGSTASAGTTDEPITTGVIDDEPPMCGEPITNCKWDDDRDGVANDCDNAPDVANPDQADFDGDGFGDVWDKCPTVPSESNFADSDRDGIGNDCDLCARSPASYNGDLVIPGYMKVRNIPGVGDSDRDGIGDACDNCVRTPNCQGYGDGLDPYEIGDPIDDEAPDCQTDADTDLVGDACAGTMMPGAAGPVGFAATDDFDQDGLANMLDGCPRLPVVFQACDGPEDCPDSGVCTAGVCAHQDSDMDGVGDQCDSCPWAPNPEQIQDGGAEEDDPDGDFVGNACETVSVCQERPDPRPFGFYDGSVHGYCCVQLGAAGTALDPDGETVPLSPKVMATPGVGVLPPGCAQEAQPVDPATAGDALWTSFCLLPQLDQDLDGVSYNCDLCPHAYDPGQEPFVDENAVEFPDYGKYCNGDYHPENFDPGMMCLPGT